MTTEELAAALEHYAGCMTVRGLETLRLAASSLRQLERVRAAVRRRMDAADAGWSGDASKMCRCEPCRVWDGRECDVVVELRAALGEVGT
jgi:hypothetical protein